MVAVLPTDLSLGAHAVEHEAPLRVITATSLFDGHDAAINVMRRMLQAAGAEVIHLGHNRSVAEIVETAVEEDARAVAVSSYQGGHMEFFSYLVNTLRASGAGHVRVFGGGGGVILPEEIAALENLGVTRIYSPEDGRRLGLKGMIADLMARCARQKHEPAAIRWKALARGDRLALSRLLSGVENGWLSEDEHRRLQTEMEACGRKVSVLGVTGTGGSGKSSLTDELVRRFRLDSDERIRIGILAVDPSRKRSGGALLGDRIRMNAIDSPNIYMRSVATRDSVREIPLCLGEMLGAVGLGGFDLIIVETPGIGQGDTGITAFCDVSLYVMTPEFGADSQLEKIDMLDFADVVAVNKFDRPTAPDAKRAVAKQLQRNREAFHEDVKAMPVYGTIASRVNDVGVTALYFALRDLLQAKGLAVALAALPRMKTKPSTGKGEIVPASRRRYLAEIAECLRNYRSRAIEQAKRVRVEQQLKTVKKMVHGDAASVLKALSERSAQAPSTETKALLEEWENLRERYLGNELKIDDGEGLVSLKRRTLAGIELPRVALPDYTDRGDLLKWLMLENLPGHFPYTAGVFPFKREDEDPTRMFAGEGDPQRTNRRFKYLSAHSKAKRLSTAFDSVTLYACDPDERPDIYGKIGNSGVSVATLDDMKALYEGFDLCDPNTSVSMTINGPAPTILAMFFNAAIDQQLERFAGEKERKPTEAERNRIAASTLERVRGTVQADILKEDQGQNTCIFSTEFSLKLMADVEDYFIRHNVRRFYSVSISGYHIAEAGANPVTQLAFTLANGFTYVEAYLARGMAIDGFAPNLSFFFSNGMDPEYAVLGRVARRIWAVAMRERYGANTRSQKLKYHIQTSGRSLHAQEMGFNDIRTTLQALNAIYDNCNSLHTNASDEAVTTPTEETVRHALAIQLIINREWGLAKNENPNQGSFLIDYLTDRVEEAVLAEFERLSERGGVLGAMETGYQRAKIQEESMIYEQRKHDGSLPIVGVNTFVSPSSVTHRPGGLARSTEEEKKSQIRRLREFQARNRDVAPPMLMRLREAALRDENLFDVLMDAVRCCSLGQISAALYDVGGRYRRNM